MYIPKHFEITDPQVIDSFLAEYSFATVFASRDGVLDAVHVPILVSSDRQKISFHIAHANPMKNLFTVGTDVLVVLNGPHGYVSPRWYSTPNVPTWNYATVHFHSKLGRVLNTDEVKRDLNELVSKFESSDYAEEMFQGVRGVLLTMKTKLLPGIIGYELDVRDMQVKFKVSQNRDQESLKKVIAELRSSARRSDVDLGEFMDSYYKNNLTEKSGRC